MKTTINLCLNDLISRHCSILLKINPNIGVKTIGVRAHSDLGGWGGGGGDLLARKIKPCLNA